MANNEYVNRVDYGEDTLIDISDTTAEAGDVLVGQVFYTRSGAPATGTLDDATQSTHGLMSAADKVKVDHSITESDIIVDKEPYIFRQTSNGLDNGNRSVEKLIGGTVAWNQLVASARGSTTVYNVVLTRSEDLHSLTLSGTPNSSGNIGLIGNIVYVKKDHVYIADMKALSTNDTYLSFGSSAGNGKSAVMIKATDAGSRGFNLHVTSGVEINITVVPQVFDLTQMFGSTVADAIYAMEQATAGSGIAWFRNLFPKAYYAYDAGSLQSVQVKSHITRGFNAWDEEWELGSINATTGANSDDSSVIRSKNYIHVVPGATYYYSVNPYAFFGYDANKNYTGTIAGASGSLLNIPENVHYIRFRNWSAYGTTYKNDICINISDPAKNETYRPYQEHTYPFDSDLILRGIPKWADGKMYYDGDEYTADGMVTRKYGIVDLGTLTWSYNSSSAFFKTKVTGKLVGNKNIVCAKYEISSSTTIGDMSDKQIKGYPYDDTDRDAIYVKDSNYSSADTFETAMSGVYLVYELATPTTESADPFTGGMLCSPDGTEEFIDAGVTALTPTRDVAIPVGHETTYGGNPYVKTINNYYAPDLNGNLNISYNTLLDKPDLSPYLTSVPTMVGATSNAAGTAGLVPAPATTDVDKFLAGDGTYKSGGLPMVILSYGNSTWADFEAAYNNNVIVYCRASSNSNPASGSQTRMAFMAYVNDATSPTNVEFQYYRSMNSHSISAMGDQVFVYKLDKTSGWSVTTRDASIKQITGSGITVGWNSNVVTLTNDVTVSDSLTDTSTTKALSAAKGKELQDTIGSAAMGTTATTLTGAIGELSDQIGTLNSNKMEKPTNAGAQGQLLQNDGNGGAEWTNAGTPSDAQVGAAVSTWLAAHPEATTTVQDGAITRAKLDADLKEKTDAVPDLKSALDRKADIVYETLTDQPIAHVEDGADNLPVTDLVVGIEPVQDLHGYDYPWPARGGKNLLKTVGTTTTLNGVTATFNDDGSVKLTGTATEQSDFYIIPPYTSGITLPANTNLIVSGGISADIFVRINVDGQTPTSRGGDVSVSSTNGVVGTSYIRVASGTATNVTVYPMVRLATISDDTWEPYSNICPISGWTGCNVSRTGKNLLQQHTVSLGNPGSRTTNIILENPIPPGTYTMSFTRSGTYTGIAYGIQLLSDSELFGSFGETNKVLTITKWANRLYFYFPQANYNNNETVIFEDMQIELGSSASAYEPYQGNTYSITFPNEAGTVYGGTLTIDKDGTGTLVVDRAGFTLDGSSSSGIYIYSAANGFRVQPYDITGKYMVSGGNLPGKSNLLKNVTYSTEFGVRFGIGSNSIYLCQCYGVFGDSVNAFLTYLQNNPIQFVYPLATPITYELTDLEVIETLKGMNNVWADAGKINEVQYSADTKLYIAKELTASRQLMELIVTANHEDSMKATKAYSTGNLLIVNGTLYKATTSIANGATLTVGTNVTATTVANELALLA